MKLPLPASLQKVLSALRLRKSADPRRDWLVLVGVFVLGLAATVIWSSFFFLGVIGREPATPGVNANGTPDTRAVERVRVLAGEREREALRYEEEYRFVDPSR